MLKKVYLELTNRCNLNCQMCYRHTWQEELKDMDIALLHTCIDEINQIPTVETVVVGGIGEPCVAPSLLFVLEALKEKKIILTTNGTNHEQGLIEKLVETTHQIVVSIDGDEVMFQQIRGIQIQVVLDFLLALNEEKKRQHSKTPSVSFQMTLSQSTEKDIPQVLRWAKEYGAQRVIISHLLPTTKEESQQISYRRYENIAGKQLAKRINLRACQLGLEVSLPAMELKTERHCRFVEEGAMMIRVDGKVVPCYRLAHDSTEWVFGREKHITTHSFGQAGVSKLIDIWQQPHYERFRKTLLEQNYPSCIDCDLVEGCDMVRHTETDCHSNQPSCGDCLWARNMIYCV